MIAEYRVTKKGKIVQKPLLKKRAKSTDDVKEEVKVDDGLIPQVAVIKLG